MQHLLELILAKKKLSPDGTRKITPRGIGDGMGGGFALFLIMKVENF